MDEGQPRDPASPANVSFVGSPDDVPLIDRVRKFVLRGTNGVVTDDEDALPDMEPTNVEIKSVLMDDVNPNDVNAVADDDKSDKGNQKLRLPRFPRLLQMYRLLVSLRLNLS